MDKLKNSGLKKFFPKSIPYHGWKKSRVPLMAASLLVRIEYLYQRPVLRDITTARMLLEHLERGKNGKAVQIMGG
jgi:UDP-N-acetylglucosamine enolpyruvyl transferase